jgi:hypothetical protein
MSDETRKDETMTRKRKNKPESSKGKRARKTLPAPIVADVIPNEPNGPDVTVEMLATFARACFKRSKRDNGEEYWLKKDGTPEWVETMTMEAHGSMLPDDWKYSFIVEALSALSDHADTDEARDSLEADIYNSELHRWLGSHLERAGYVDEAIKEYGSHSDNGIEGDIAIGQLAEMHEVFSSVLSALESRVSELEAESA